MVLQRPPARPRIWGFGSSVGEQIVVSLDTGTQTVITNSVLAPDGTTIIWEALFQPITTTGPHSISIQAGVNCVITLANILIGDIWICSGQSNMEMSLSQIDNPQPDINDAVNYPMVRKFHAATATSDTPLMDLAGISRNWEVPNAGNVGSFSAICWLFGRNLFRKYLRPIGVIDTTWGGTRIEAWSSAQANSVCYPDGTPPGGGSNAANVLFNAMINPFIKMPIFGAIWYQGESNSGVANMYSCSVRAMVTDWRSRWSMNNPEMDTTFPFGQVQLAAWKNNMNSLDFTDLRWAQTDGLGYTPNTRMVKYFLAVAIDLPDFNSPAGDIHPRYKRPIADRLALGAFSVAYGSTDNGTHQGPIPGAFSISGPNIVVSYGVLLNFGDTANIFEICCGETVNNTCSAGGVWRRSFFVSDALVSVSITNPCAGTEVVTGFRYLWRESPCPLQRCPIYSRENELPAPPFIHNGVISRRD
jgi:sialate O-acetylesterase